MEQVPHAFGLSSRRPGPGELVLVLYGGPRWGFWRPPLLSERAGSSVCPSIHEVLGPPLYYPTPLKHPGRGWGIAFWDFCTGLLCGTAARRLLHIYEGPLGRTGNTTPSSSGVIPMGSKRFALQGTQSTRFSSSVHISTSIEANPTAVTGPVSCFWGSVWGSRSLDMVATPARASTLSPEEPIDAVEPGDAV